MIRVAITRHERRLLARAAGRGLRAKRIPATLPSTTVKVMRTLLEFVEPQLKTAVCKGVVLSESV